MGIMPYGYFVEDGKIRIDEESALKVRKLFLLYTVGLSIQRAAKVAEINKLHASVGAILSCRKYLGDDIFPKIIDGPLFENVQKKRAERSRKLGRDKRKRKETSFPIGKRFAFKEVAVKMNDPLTQAQAIYETIVEVE
jgi:hypothetical protein